MRQRTTRDLVWTMPVLAGAIAILIGSLLVWGRADVPLLGRVELDGVAGHREGLITIILAAALIPTVLPTPQQRLRALVAFALASAALAVALADAAQLAGRRGIVDGWGLGLVDVSVGPGLILVIVGAALATAAAGAALAAPLVANRDAAGPIWRRPPAPPTGEIDQ